MKMGQVPLLLCLLYLVALAPGPAAAAVAAGSSKASGDRTVTQVVKLLQELISKAKAEGDTEQNLYAKYKCYCDTNEEEKNAEIEKLTEEIAVLEAKIEKLLAANAQLSKEVAKLDADKAANVLARDKATEIRNKEKDVFDALEADLEDAIGKMGEAIQALSEVGADQTLSTSTGHQRFMAGHQVGLSSLKSTVKKALLAASAFAGDKEQHKVESFLQAPFTGVYSAQSGEVVGILKDMRDTFKANLNSARVREAAAVAAHRAYIKAMTEAWNAMDEQYNSKQGELSSNDAELASKRTQLADAESSKADAETFLERLLKMCAAKKVQYHERVALRAQEQAALSEAIAILNSDAAFAMFGTVQATKSTDAVPAFVQVQRHQHASSKSVQGSRQVMWSKVKNEAAQRHKVQAFLESAADKADSEGAVFLSRIAGMLQAYNPFTTVLKEIKKMIGLLDQEAKADAKQHGWCVTEREDTRASIATAQGEIQTLTGQINNLKTEIEDPETGLLVQLDENEENLKECIDNQASETADRTEANLEYQKNIANLVEAQALLNRAVVVLQKYYAKIKSEMEGAPAEGVALLQVSEPSATEPAPPETWEDNYTGQKHQGSSSAIGMLKFILSNSADEETEAHKAEVADQHEYEDSMAGLKDMEMGLEATLVQLKSSLAQTRKNLHEKQQDLERTEAEKAALEAYLLKIKPGCDFITTNLDNRIKFRTTEAQALQAAEYMLMNSPAYKEAMAVAHNESLHDCLEICYPDEEHVNCKACLGDVTVPGYCAGHPATSGCTEVGAGGVA